MVVCVCNYLLVINSKCVYNLRRLDKVSSDANCVYVTTSQPAAGQCKEYAKLASKPRQEMTTTDVWKQTYNVSHTRPSLRQSVFSQKHESRQQ